MVSSTSLIISGSSAEVGSSNSMILGFMHSARAIATRCCWPPESWPGYFFACSGIFTRVRYSIASSSASFFGILRTQIGASVQFSSTVRCGNRLKDWNTMPTSRRMASSARRSSDSSMPSTTIWPSWCVSSRLMQRIMVDLPDPDGPQTTTRSPSATVQVDVAQHVQRAEPLVDLVQHDHRRGVGAVGEAMAAFLAASWLSRIPTCRASLSARWRLSSRSRPWLYLDMAKQKTR